MLSNQWCFLQGFSAGLAVSPLDHLSSLVAKQTVEQMGAACIGWSRLFSLGTTSSSGI